MTSTDNPRRVISETRMIASDTDGVQLQLINKRPEDVAAFPSDRTLVLMHGATFPSQSLFDVPVGNGSFMDVLARAGYDVWAVDVRGYGGSTRQPAMTSPPEDTTPLTRGPTAIRDLASAITFVCQHRGVAQVNLLGMSWGATIAGAFAAAHPRQIMKLILVTPLWLSNGPRRIDPGGPLGRYRVVNVKAFEIAWKAAAPVDKRETLIPPGWFEAWESVTLATDPNAPLTGTIRAPAGAVQDTRDYWTVNNPSYDPSKIDSPVLMVCGEWDIDVTMEMARDLFFRLANAPYKRSIEIGAATHMVLMERHRQQAFDAIVTFLDETFEPSI
jgi:pimeloyl-ACP methyl ester carboxylesterase